MAKAELVQPTILVPVVVLTMTVAEAKDVRAVLGRHVSTQSENTYSVFSVLDNLLFAKGSEVAA